MKKEKKWMRGEKEQLMMPLWRIRSTREIHAILPVEEETGRQWMPHVFPEKISEFLFRDPLPRDDGKTGAAAA